MRTLNRRMFLIGFSIVLVQEALAQTTAPDNNPGTGRYLGFNAGQNLEFRTNNTTRMQMMQNGNSTINGFGVNRSGFLGLSQDPNFFTGGVATPFSLLHLNGDNAGANPQQTGYRDWMRHGMVSCNFRVNNLIYEPLLQNPTAQQVQRLLFGRPSSRRAVMQTYAQGPNVGRPPPCIRPFLKGALLLHARRRKIGSREGL